MIGQTISHYRIIEKLGGGGMGVSSALYTKYASKIRQGYRPHSRHWQALAALANVGE